MATRLPLASYLIGSSYLLFIELKSARLSSDSLTDSLPALSSLGVFRGGHDVLVRSRLALADGVTMQVTVRSGDETAVDVILASVG